MLQGYEFDHNLQSSTKIRYCQVQAICLIWQGFLSELLDCFSLYRTSIVQLAGERTFAARLHLQLCGLLHFDNPQLHGKDQLYIWIHTLTCTSFSFRRCISDFPYSPPTACRASDGSTKSYQQAFRTCLYAQHKALTLPTPGKLMSVITEPSFVTNLGIYNSA